MINENVILDRPVAEKCWNLYDSYGEICVGCGCCSKDPLTRVKARINVLTHRIGYYETFDSWFADQNLRAFKRQLLYYRGRLEELEVKDS